MQGAGHPIRRSVPRSRIIPAHAGSSPHMCADIAQTRDHPRACREQPQRLDAAFVTPRSSPRMQGAAVGMAEDQRGDRIIPAHAGSSSITSTSHNVFEDHPRACREQYRMQGERIAVAGSSPRMQGAGDGDLEPAGVARIIPAHAGSSVRNVRRPLTKADHPRACREQLHYVFLV